MEIGVGTDQFTSENVGVGSTLDMMMDEGDGVPSKSVDDQTIEVGTGDEFTSDNVDVGLMEVEVRAESAATSEITDD